MTGQKTVAENRKARHEYELFDRFEAGIELKGTEIKSVRKGKVQLKDSYISIVNGEAYIKGMHISPYEFGNRFNHEETRDRRLLLHKKEILKLKIKIPDMKEQIKILDLMQNNDKLLKNTFCQITEMNLFKKSLLQQMFV